MRILLVQPGEGKGVLSRYLGRVEPLGLEAVAGGLRGHDVHLVDLRIEDNLEEELEHFHPQLCGISCSFTVDTYRALEVAQIVKESGEESRPFVVIGGHHASLNPTHFHHRAVDAVVIGEGEWTLAELVECLERGREVRTVRGLVLNTESRQIRTGVRPLTQNLDSLPMPARELTRRNRKRYYIGGSWPLAVLETARGCPYRCNFCSVWQFYRGRYRDKSPTRVADEIASVEEPYILLTDDNFLAEPERARQIAILLKARGVRHRYTFQARSDSIVAHPDLISLWRQIGLDAVFVGLEKIDQAELLKVNKANSVDSNDRALEVLHREGVGVTGSFIVDPSWERKDFEALRRYVRMHRIEVPSFSVLTPLPGTVLYRQVRERLQTGDYELFDFLHAVLPTQLPLPEFYTELAALYRSSYSMSRMLFEQVRAQWRRLLRGSISISQLRALMGAARSVTTAGCYLAGHTPREPHLINR